MVISCNFKYIQIGCPTIGRQPLACQTQETSRNRPCSPWEKLSLNMSEPQAAKNSQGLKFWMPERLTIRLSYAYLCIHRASPKSSGPRNKWDPEIQEFHNMSHMSLSKESKHCYLKWFSGRPEHSCVCRCVCSAHKISKDAGAQDVDGRHQSQTF